MTIQIKRFENQLQRTFEFIDFCLEQYWKNRGKSTDF